MVVHLVDGTYELFRQFYGRRRGGRASDRPLGAVAGVLHSILQMIEDGSDPRRRRHRPRDRVVPQRSVAGLQDRRRRRPRAAGAVPAAGGRARGDGRRGVADGRARGRRRAGLGGAHRRRGRRGRAGAASGRRTRTSPSACAATASCRSTAARTRSATRPACARSSASSRALIPDLLALVGDAADGYPGHPRDRQGRRGAAPQPARPDRELPGRRCSATAASWRCCSRTWPRCAPARTLFGDVDELRWAGPGPGFEEWAEALGDDRLVERGRRRPLFALAGPPMRTYVRHGRGDDSARRPGRVLCVGRAAR